jgi:hypothetical protein
LVSVNSATKTDRYLDDYGSRKSDWRFLEKTSQFQKSSENARKYTEKWNGLGAENVKTNKAVKDIFILPVEAFFRFIFVAQKQSEFCIF